MYLINKFVCRLIILHKYYAKINMYNILRTKKLICNFHLYHLYK